MPLSPHLKSLLVNPVPEPLKPLPPQPQGESPPIEPDPVAVESFLRLLFKNEPGWLSLWNGKTQASHHLQWPQEGVGELVAEKVRQGQEIYFGCALRREKPEPSPTGASRRGTQNEISVLPGFWLDIDIYHPTAHKSPDLVPNWDTLKRLLETRFKPPTLYVHSGYGVHCWYLFREPLRVARDEIPVMKARYKKLHQRVQVALAPYGVDPVYDLARVLRLPGTLNRKLEEPKLVRLLNF